MRSRVWTFLQGLIVVVLFAAAIVSLWRAGETVAAREQYRQRIAHSLIRAEDELARRGAAGLVLVPSWPDSLGPGEWQALDQWLTQNAHAALSDGQNLDGGYYLVGFNRFMGRARSGDSEAVGSEPPAASRALVEAQIHQALDDDRPHSLLVESPPLTKAIRTAPVWINGRLVAATWTLAEIDEVPSVAATLQGYRLSATLALVGIFLAMVIALGLAWKLRRQARVRARLQADLRRSERLASLGKMIAGVAHEVRNPLAGIRSTAQLCERGLPLDAEAAAGLTAEVDRLDAIVSRLLQFSRVHHENRSAGNLNDLVLEAARLIKPMAEEAGVLIELELDHRAPSTLLSVPTVLQVLRNLTTNALQAMPNGGILRFATGHDSAHRQVHVTVSDSGSGLPPDVQAHLFEPFFTTKPQGTGLGLAIAREIALAHQGSIEAWNRAEGSGAAFRLRLPVITTPSGEDAAADGRPGSESKPDEKPASCQLAGISG